MENPKGLGNVIDDGDNKLDDEETEGNREVEIIDYDGDKKSDELEETNAGGEVERKPWKSERVRKRASIMTYDEMAYDEMTYDEMTYDEMTYDEMTYDEMGGNPRKTYR